MNNDHPKSVAKSAASFSSGTLLTRFAGLLREMAMAFCFGVSPAIAAFFAAFRFANLMRRLFGEGSLLAGFSPHFEAIRHTSPERAAEFFRDLFFSLTLFLSFIIGVVEIGLFSWWKWGNCSPETSHILYLTMLMLPGVLFICLFALFSALLQCEKKYFLPGLAPIMFNIATLMAIWWVKDWPAFEATIGLAASIVVGFLFQWIMVIPSSLQFLRQFLSWKTWLKARLFSPELRHMAAALTFTVIGVGAVQINAALDSIFALYASASGPAYLNYATRLHQLPLALFGIALSSALLPPLARAIQAGASEQYLRLLHFSLSRSFSLMMPCTIGILVLGAAGVNLVYGRGDFDLSATANTVTCLWGYGVGLVPAVFVLLLAPAFYAQKDYRTPLRGSLLAVGLNLALNTVLIFGLGLGSASVAMATSFAAFFNCQYLASRLSKKIGPLFDKATLQSFAKTAFCSVIAGGMTLLLGHYILGDASLSLFMGDSLVSFPRAAMDQILQFFALAGFFLLTFLSYAWMLNIEEVLQLIGLARKS